MLRRFLLLVLILLPALQVLAQSTTAVSAEACGQANLRAAAALESALLGEIRQGQRWPVLARSEHFPWLLLGDAEGKPLGWVYEDLVTLSAGAASLPVSTMVLSPQRDATASPPGPEQPVATGAAPTTALYGSLAGTVNIRQGPGVEYARVAVGQAGERYQLSARHSLLPWVQIVDARSPGGHAWIARELLQIQGDLAGAARDITDRAAPAHPYAHALPGPHLGARRCLWPAARAATRLRPAGAAGLGSVARSRL